MRDLVLEMHPVVLGGGLRLFGRRAPLDLTLVEATAFGSGAVGLVYRPGSA